MLFIRELREEAREIQHAIEALERLYVGMLGRRSSGAKSDAGGLRQGRANARPPRSRVRPKTAVEVHPVTRDIDDNDSLGEPY